MSMDRASAEMNAFVRVIERGSFAAASGDLGITPSALSKLVTRIEDRLGVRLLTRTTRRLALTSEGEVFVARSHEILAAIEAAEAEVTAASRLPRGHLRISVGTAIAKQILGPALPVFLKTLKCSTNHLSVLPSLPSTLETINCNHNNLTVLPTFPTGIKNLNSISTLLFNFHKLFKANC